MSVVYSQSELFSPPLGRPEKSTVAIGGHNTSQDSETKTIISDNQKSAQIPNMGYAGGGGGTFIIGLTFTVVFLLAVIRICTSISLITLSMAVKTLVAGDVKTVPLLPAGSSIVVRNCAIAMLEISINPMIVITNILIILHIQILVIFESF